MSIKISNFYQIYHKKKIVCIPVPKEKDAKYSMKKKKQFKKSWQLETDLAFRHRTDIIEYVHRRSIHTRDSGKKN